MTATITYTDALIILALLTLATWMLWKAVGEDPDEFERRADEFNGAVQNLREAIREALRRKR